MSAILVSFAGQSPAGSTQTTGTPAAPAKHRTASTSKSSKSKAHRRSKSRKGAWKHHGQQQIQPERASAIQQALIREKYLSGEANGQWDARTQAAMARYQSDNGWQSKITPDSRALIKLGLGPNYSDKNMMLLMPKATSDPVATSAVGSAGTTSKQR